MSGQTMDDLVVGARHDPDLAVGLAEAEKNPAMGKVEMPPVYDGRAQRGSVFERPGEVDAPTEEEINTLRHISDKVPWSAYTVAFIELCERFSYYGTTAVFTNFIQQPLPANGNKAGAGGTDGQSGALGKGQRASTGLGTFNTFWIYLVPLFGAYVADTYWGRYKTITISLVWALVGHVLLIISALPVVIAHPNGALGLFSFALIIMGIGTGGFKANISPLVAEQSKNTYLRVQELPSGERVIVDPALTSGRIYMYFYLMINVGALIGQLGMVYAEKYVGYWLAYLLPTAVFCLCPMVLFACRNKYVRSPPQGSVLGKSMRTFFFAMKGRWHFNPVATYKHLNDGTMWQSAKPSNIAPANRPEWMTFDDNWVEEVRRGFHACSVFCWYPLYWITYNQLNNNLTSQAATMKLNNLPNEVLSNLDPFALIILIPIFDYFLYPWLRKMGINFSALKRICLGFWTGAFAMVWAAVVQHYIYKDSVCGKYASGTWAGHFDKNGDPAGCPPVSISVWVQSGSYILIAISEIFASITGLEYAYTKAPRNMKSLVMSLFLFMNALSAAIGEAFVALSADPLLVWNYASAAILAGVAATIFWLQYRGLDKEEDRLNNLQAGKLYEGEEPVTAVEQPRHDKEIAA